MRPVEGLAFLLAFFVLLNSIRLRTGRCTVGSVPVMRLRGHAHCIDGPSNVLSSATIAAVSDVLCTLRRGANVRALIMTMANVRKNSYFSFTRQLKRRANMKRGRHSGKLIVLLSASRQYIRFTAKCNLRKVLPSTVYGQVRGHCVLPCFGSGG